MIFDSLVTSSLGGLQTQNELLSSHGIASDEFQQKVVAQGISVKNFWSLMFEKGFLNSGRPCISLA